MESMEESTQVTGENVERKIKEAFGEVGTPIEGIERIGFYLDFGRDNKELEKVVNTLMPEIYGLLSRFFHKIAVSLVTDGKIAFWIIRAG